MRDAWSLMAAVCQKIHELAGLKQLVAPASGRAAVSQHPPSSIHHIFSILGMECCKHFGQTPLQRFAEGRRQARDIACEEPALFPMYVVSMKEI